MRKTTFEQRMKSYIILIILTGAFLTLSTGFMWLTTNAPTVGMLDLPVIEKANATPLLPVIELDVVAQIPTINPDNFNGDIVIATNTEVITMTTVNGVKTFTNHLIG